MSPTGETCNRKPDFTHSFGMSTAKFFALEMLRLVKLIESDGKISFALFIYLKFTYFNFCEIFLLQNQSDFFLKSRGAFT